MRRTPHRWPSGSEATPQAAARPCTLGARVHSFARGMYFVRREIRQQVEAGKLDATIAANLKELGYGG